MAPKHDEIVRHQSNGWTVAWDANTVEPATRKAFDKVIADNARTLREVLQQTSSQMPSQDARPSAQERLGQPRRSRRGRAAA